MKKFIKKEDLDYVKIRANKYLKTNTLIYSDVINLCDTVSELLKQNVILRQNLFELEQNVPEEQQWQNVLASKMDRAIDGKKDFLEINNSINNQIYTISIQRKFGKTPQQLLEISEIKRKKAVKKIVNLFNDLKKSKEITNNLIKEIRVLQKFGVSNFINSDNIESFSAEELKKVIDIVNDKIKSFNQMYFNKKLLTLHTSVRSAFQEAWSRAVSAELKIDALQTDNKKLKFEFLKKKYPRCRIYRKGRNSKH